MVAVSFSPTSAIAYTNNVIFSSNGGSSTSVVTGARCLYSRGEFQRLPHQWHAVSDRDLQLGEFTTGTISNRFLNFGDGFTTNTTLTSVAHTYTVAGTNTVTLITSGPVGVSTNMRTLNYIIVFTPFQAWQNQYFGCDSCPQAGASADPDGDGLNNDAEFLAGTSPTSNLSALRITSTVLQSNNVIITWATAGIRTSGSSSAPAPAPTSWTSAT